MDLIQMVVLLSCHVLALLDPVRGICRFPDFAQTDVNGRDWQSGIRSEFRKFTVTVTIRNSKMTVEPTDPGTATYERICVQALSDHRYVTAHEQKRQRHQRFACVQFLLRSDSVIQLRVSDVADSMSGICDEQKLRLDPWLLVDRNSILDQRQLCPLTGGYSVKLYDREYNRGFCDAYKDHVWLESECVPGSGLYFNFRYARCIPNVLMSEQQRALCVANWTEAGYAYSLLRHDRQRYVWLFRYPASVRHLDSFVAHLVRDLYASTGSHITGIDAYVQMDMVRDIAHPVTSLCIDEFEGCSYHANPCSDGRQMALTCARTCHVCNATRPRMCEFSEHWLGDWTDPSHGDRLAVRIRTRTMTVYYGRLEQTFHCVRWDEPYVGRTGRHATYRMLVTEFANGCRPKYSCVRIVQRPSSAILFLQLSAERHWPITDSVAEPIDCARFDFDGDTETLIPNRYRARHHRMLYSRRLDAGVACRLPLGGAVDYAVTLSDGSRCSGTLSTSDPGSSSLTVTLSGCAPDASRLLPERHSCVESARLFGSDYVVVSRAILADATSELFCWIFTKRSRSAGSAAVADFYLVKSAHCNDGIRRRIVRGHFVPLASFGTDPDTPTAAISGRPIPVQSTPLLTDASRGYVIPVGDSPPAGSPVVDMTPSADTGSRNATSGRDATTYSRNSTSRPPPNPATYASPVVVVAAIIFFVIFQIPCLCKNS